MTYRVWIKPGLLTAALFVLTGCVSVLPEPVVPEGLYRPEPAAVVASLDDSLIIRELESPQIFSGQAMISEDETGALLLVPSVQWAGRSTRLLQLALIDSFDDQAEGAALLPETGVRTAFELSTRIKTLALRGDEAICEMSGSVIGVASRSVIAQTTVTASDFAASSRAGDRAVALKQASEACITDLAAFAALAVQAASAD